MKDEIGIVYFIGAVDSKGEKVKIGMTRQHPKKRLMALQTGSPCVLNLLGFYVTNRVKFYEWLEHEKFKDCREHGEWFRLPHSIAPKMDDGKHPGFRIGVGNPDHMDIDTYLSREKNKMKKWYSDIA